MAIKLSMLWLDFSVAADNAFVPEILEDYFEILVCPTAEQADKAIIEQAPDVVCMNFDYPDRQGLKITQRLKAAHASVPMIMTTIQHWESLAVWAFRCRLTDYLVKPISSEELTRVYKVLLGIAEAREDQRERKLGRTIASLPVEVGSTPRSSQRAFMPAVYYVAHRYNEKMTAADVAATCHMSPTSFSRDFKEAFGLSFRDYVVRYRLREAHKLMQSPVARVTDVAMATGFNDVSYFSRTFKQYFGRCPSELLTRPDTFFEDGSPSQKLKIPRELIQEA